MVALPVSQSRSDGGTHLRNDTRDSFIEFDADKVYCVKEWNYRQTNPKWRRCYYEGMTENQVRQPQYIFRTMNGTAIYVFATVNGRIKTWDEIQDQVRIPGKAGQ